MADNAQLFMDDNQNTTPELSLEQTKQAIAALSEEDYTKLREWTIEHDHARWDKQIENDLNEGRFDGLLEELREEIKSGQTTPL